MQTVWVYCMRQFVNVCAPRAHCWCTWYDSSWCAGWIVQNKARCCFFLSFAFLLVLPFVGQQTSINDIRCACLLAPGVVNYLRCSNSSEYSWLNIELATNIRRYCTAAMRLSSSHYGLSDWFAISPSYSYRLHRTHFFFFLENMDFSISFSCFDQNEIKKMSYRVSFGLS